MGERECSCPLLLPVFLSYLPGFVYIGITGTTTTADIIGVTKQQYRYYGPTYICYSGFS
jgi:hypothetical protein